MAYLPIAVSSPRSTVEGVGRGDVDRLGRVLEDLWNKSRKKPKGLLRPPSEPAGGDREALSGDFLGRFTMGFDERALVDKDGECRTQGLIVAVLLRIVLDSHKSHDVSLTAQN